MRILSEAAFRRSKVEDDIRAQVRPLKEHLLKYYLFDVMTYEKKDWAVTIERIIRELQYLDIKGGTFKKKHFYTYLYMEPFSPPNFKKLKDYALWLRSRVGKPASREADQNFITKFIQPFMVWAVAKIVEGGLEVGETEKELSTLFNNATQGEQ
jgi:hypothetical protein